MDHTLITPLISALQNLSGETISIVMFIGCVYAILTLLRLFGFWGLFLFNIVAVIAGNIQVLKLSEFLLVPEPVALGTVIFATTFLCSDLLTEHYGLKIANQGVWLTVSAQILMTFLMIFALGHKPATMDCAHTAMETLFLPSCRLLIASLIAFAASQFLEISLFQKISTCTQGRFLWLRTNIATILAALLDNILFSVLAWVILSPSPVGFKTLIFTYILGTYLARIMVSLLSTPVMYLSYLFLPPQEQYSKS